MGSSLERRGEVGKEILFQSIDFSKGRNFWTTGSGIENMGLLLDGGGTLLQARLRLRSCCRRNVGFDGLLMGRFWDRTFRPFFQVFFEAVGVVVVVVSWAGIGVCCE